MENLTTIVNLNSKYRMVIERAASTKGILGYKVEANGDDLTDVARDTQLLKNTAEEMTREPLGLQEVK